ncbi:MAG TPA: hypothetical protein VGT24_10580 [Candidatus Acidoferrales bacterium]|nr:hypothetical protein [Candidatus Acidoferrales bacterium]
MGNHSRVSYLLLLGIVLAFAGVLLAQNAPDRALIVNGKAAGMVVQVGGRSYVDLETVAQFTNATVTLEPSRILLTFPAPGASPAPAPPSVALPTPPPPGLSRDFARLAIAELAEMREWRGAVGIILSYGVPVVGSWPQDYHDRAENDLNQVAVAATTSADHDALQLLQNEFANLSQWASDIVATRNSLNATRTVNPNAMQDDQMLAKITNCGRFMSSMLVSGTFADDPSCH